MMTAIKMELDKQNYLKELCIESDKPNLIVMVGVSGSGKSTATEKIENKLKEFGIQVKHFSSDEYRVKICGDVNCQTQNDKVFSTLYKDLGAWIKHKGSNVCSVAILDATNLNIKDRKRILHETQQINKLNRIAYIVNTPLSLCIENDGKRVKRTVGIKVIQQQVSKFQCPQKFEGFNHIVFDNKQSKPLIESTLFEMMRQFDQKNPHHVGTLWEHCNKLSSFYETDTILHKAAKLHDIGKMSTQSFDEQGIAHYYNHDNYGAYIVCSHCKECMEKESLTINDFLLLVLIVNYHMNFHKDWRTEKYKNMLGESNYNMMVEFAEHDKISSGTMNIHNELMSMMKEQKLSLDEIRNSQAYKYEKEKFLNAL